MSGGSFAPFAWQPALVRTIALWDITGAAPKGRIAAFMPLRWPGHPSGAILDYTLDATALLAGDSDALSAAIASTGDLVLNSVLALGGKLTLWLSGGQAGTDNQIDLTLTTLSTRRVHRIIRLRVI